MLKRLVSIAVLGVMVTGCSAGVVAMKAPRSLVAPAIVHCNDGVGHIAGSVPWIYGGTCVCTPTRARFESQQAEKTIPADVTYAGYLKLYEDRGIKVGPGHAGCNNRCAEGPHVVFGGKCMATPTVGTMNYEQVTQGKR